MKPYYDRDGITLYNCDFREPDVSEHIKSASCIIADPPYGETSLEWDKWPSGWPGYLAGVVAPNTSLWCFGSARMFLENASEFTLWRFTQDIVWEKHNGSSFVNDRFKRVHESAYQFVLRGATWGDIYKAPIHTQDARARVIRGRSGGKHTGKIGTGVYVSEEGGPRMMRSVIYSRSCHGYAVNETQKPEGIVSPLVEYSCPKDGQLFSPFCGSGTDLVVAKKLGIRAIGCELRLSQCEAAVQRLSQDILNFSEATC